MEYKVIILEQAKEFLTNLEPKLMAKAFRTINLLKQFGPVLTLPHSRKIIGSDELYELRVQYGNNICRLFYFYYKNELYVILSGFIKKQDKTDPKEIERALKIIREYMEERDEENKSV
ncbi:MAG: type II toxin-antitoxin system RelE/ParE family toxin [Spirochaetaceae bacterium]|nr:type II toxin-antitoxin system RelE/ParE family toxin [Spirochaetaceae bacterium]